MGECGSYWSHRALELPSYAPYMEGRLGLMLPAEKETHTASLSDQLVRSVQFHLADHCIECSLFSFAV